MTTKLPHQVQKTSGIPNGMRTATITAVSGTSITINVSGGNFTAGVGVVTSYGPVVGDVVAVFRQDSSWLILGPTSAVNGWNLFVTTGYQNSWTDRGTGYPRGQWRRTATEVQIVGQINNGAVQAAGSIIATGLPAPTGEIAVCVASQGSTRPSLHVDTGGALRIYDQSVTGFLQFSGTYPIDAVIA